MKMPEPLFVVINPVMKALLASPLHGVVSDSIMTVTFTGRRSGKSYSTPVRYQRSGDVIRCFSTSDTQWWRNLRDGAKARLRIAGKEREYRTSVIENDPEQIRDCLREYFAEYPQDAAYHDVQLNPDKTPVEADLETASQHAIVVEARLPDA